MSIPDPPKLRGLFVNDEPAVLRTLASGLWALASKRQLVFAEGRDSARALMATSPFDAVVSDIRMASFKGAELMNEALRRFPRTVRLVLPDYAGEELVMRCVAATHQYIPKLPALGAL